jgi:hypothetical protein
MSSLIEWLLSPFVAIAGQTPSQSEAVVTPSAPSDSAPTPLNTPDLAIAPSVPAGESPDAPVQRMPEAAAGLNETKQTLVESELGASANSNGLSKNSRLTGTAVLVGTARAMLSQPGAMGVFGFENTAETPSTERPSGCEKAGCIVNRYFRQQSALRKKFVNELMHQLRRELTNDDLDNVFDEMAFDFQDEIVEQVGKMQLHELLQDCKEIEDAAAEEDVPELVDSFDDVMSSGIYIYVCAYVLLFQSCFLFLCLLCSHIA